MISADYLDDTHMEALGEMFHADTPDHNAVVMIFTDAQAARLRGRVASGQASAEELALYDRALVGKYVRHATNDYDELQVCYGGLVPALDCHEFPY